MAIIVLSSEKDLIRAFSVVKEFRPHLDFETFLSIYQEAQASDDYELVGIEEDREVVAVMGYRVLSDFVRGRHLYIDDLVSSEKFRSKGLGAELLRFAEGMAREKGCKSLRLCTGIENERGVKFYERLGWTKRAYAFTKTLLVLISLFPLLSLRCVSD